MFEAKENLLEEFTKKNEIFKKEINLAKKVIKHGVWSEMASENLIWGMETWIWLQISMRMHW